MKLKKSLDYVMGLIILTKMKPEIILPDHTIIYSESGPRSSTTDQTTCEIGYFKDQNTNISKLGRFFMHMWLEYLAGKTAMQTPWL